MHKSHKAHKHHKRGLKMENEDSSTFMGQKAESPDVEGLKAKREIEYFWNSETTAVELKEMRLVKELEDAEEKM
jgi:hypothetical protein